MNEDPTPPTAASSPDAAVGAAPVLGAGRAVAIFAAFLGVQLLVVVAAALWVGTGHARVRGVADGQAGSIAPGFLIAAALVGTALSGLVVWWMARRTLHGALAAIGWAPASVSACGRAALQGSGLVVASAVVGAFLLPPNRGLGPLGRLDDLGFGARAAGIVLVLVAAPLVEELVFRGVLYTGLARRWRPGTAATLTTLAFVALHVPQLGAYWPGWLFVGLVGAQALRARVRTGSLLPAISLHATYNLGLVLATAIR